jgi:hypothetical protein
LIEHGVHLDADANVPDGGQVLVGPRTSAPSQPKAPRRKAKGRMAA